MCRVLVGDTKYLASNRSLRLPPEKPTAAPGQGRMQYDSVMGFTNNSYVFIVYENFRNYPDYIITYDA
eukprot:m.340020 g.340020  ORF g.340020 m.340020 type:complete len:68 (-) comp139727_c0_seq1:17-220(-)